MVELVMNSTVAKSTGVRGSCGKLATWVVARWTTIFRTVPIGADYHILVIGM